LAKDGNINVDPVKNNESFKVTDEEKRQNATTSSDLGEAHQTPKKSPEVNRFQEERGTPQYMKDTPV
jgi:hypothetical protein